MVTSCLLSISLITSVSIRLFPALGEDMLRVYELILTALKHKPNTRETKIHQRNAHNARSHAKMYEKRGPSEVVITLDTQKNACKND